MSSLMQYGNDTVSVSQINTIVSLISLMSSHFLVHTFTLISNTELTTVKTFLEIGSKYYLKMGYKKWVEGNSSREDKNEGFIVLGEPGFDFSKVMNAKPKLMAAVYRSDEINSAVAKLSELVIPSSVFFFIIVLRDDGKKFHLPEASSKAIARCFRLYKPISSIPSQTFPLMFYGGPDKPKWIWETGTNDWNSFEKKTRNMTGVFVTIALVSELERKKAIKSFWENKNSFFWRAMKDHLHFRSIVHVQSISSQPVKSISSIYVALLMTIADGLGVLPVVSSDRGRDVDFIVTGLDSKYHILVRTPQYVHSWQFIFKPLAFESWICLGIIIFLITITLRVVTYYQNLSTDLSSCCLMVFGFVCSQDATINIKQLFGIFMIVSVLRVCVYTAIIFFSYNRHEGARSATMTLELLIESYCAFVISAESYIQNRINGSCAEKSIYRVIQFILGGSTNIPKSLSARLVCYTALLFSILIYQFYTSNFYSLLSTKEVSLPFTSLEQFIAKRTHALYIHPDTAIYSYIVKAQNGIFKILWDEFLKKDPSHQLRSETKNKSLNNVCKGRGAIFGLPFRMVHLRELPCKLVSANSEHFPTNIVTVVRKNFPFKSQFEFVHLRLLEAGISHKFKKEHLDFEQQHNIKSDVINEAVSLEHVMFLFAFHSAAIILSWLILGLEIMTSKTFKNKKLKKNDFPKTLGSKDFITI